MVKKGRILYVPPVVIIELEDISREDGLENRADAFKELTKYARVGRETKRLMTLDFTRSMKLPSIAEFYPHKKNGGRK